MKNELKFIAQAPNEERANEEGLEIVGDLTTRILYGPFKYPGPEWDNMRKWTQENLQGHEWKIFKLYKAEGPAWLSYEDVTGRKY